MTSVLQELAPAAGTIPTREGAVARLLRALSAGDAGRQVVRDAELVALAEETGAAQAALSLVDSRHQHYVASASLPWWLARAGRLPAATNPCPLVAASATPLLTDDARLDTRLRRAPLVLHEGLRAYAGVPVHLPSGEPVGALCVVHGETGRFDAHTLDVLRERAREWGARLGALAAAADGPPVPPGPPAPRRSTETRTRRALVVDDDPNTRALHCAALRHHGTEVVGEARDADEGWRAAACLRPDLVLLDQHMAGTSGLTVLPRLRELLPAATVVMISSSGDVAGPARAAGALFVHKGSPSLLPLLELVSAR